MKINKKTRLTLIITICIIIGLIGAFYIYTLDYYRADDNAIKAYSAAENSGKITVFYPGNNRDNETGLIFYPGGKVEAAAYAPLLEAISEEGITCILVEMPLNLAVFGINHADKVYEKFPEIQRWYLSGHSLGGAMASSYVKKNSDRLEGLVLLGAYPVNDSTIPTIVIYGSEDHGLDKSKLKDVENKIELIGGNHAYFGDYGEQKGDGTASITREAQQIKAVEEIIEFIVMK